MGFGVTSIPGTGGGILQDALEEQHIDCVGTVPLPAEPLFLACEEAKPAAKEE